MTYGMPLPASSVGRSAFARMNPASGATRSPASFEALYGQSSALGATATTFAAIAVPWPSGSRRALVPGTIVTGVRTSYLSKNGWA